MIGKHIVCVTISSIALVFSGAALGNVDYFGGNRRPKIVQVFVDQDNNQVMIIGTRLMQARTPRVWLGGFQTDVLEARRDMVVVEYPEEIQSGDHLLVIKTSHIPFDRDEWNLTLVDRPPSPLSIVVGANPDKGIEPLTVSFNCAAVGGNSPLIYEWNFGDGDIANDQNPTHAYTAVGNYTATCTVTDVRGATIIGGTTVDVLVDDTPVIVVSASPLSGNEPLQVDFECSALGGNAPLSFVWDFDDGNSSALPNVSHTYAQGVYRPACTVTDVDGDQSEGALTITVDP